MAHVGEEVRLRLARRLGRLFRDDQLLLRLLSLGDVEEGDHRPHDLAVAVLRVGPVLRLEGAAVLSPEHLIVGVGPFPVLVSHEDAALVLVDGRAVRVPVVDHVVHVAADQLLLVAVPQKLDTGAVAEGADPVRVGAVDRFGGGIEDEAEHLAPLDDLPARQAALGDVFDDGDLAAGRVVIPEALHGDPCPESAAVLAQEGDLLAVEDPVQREGVRDVASETEKGVVVGVPAAGGKVQKLFGLISEDLLELAVAAHDGAVLHEDDAGRRRIEDRPLFQVQFLELGRSLGEGYGLHLHLGRLLLELRRLLPHRLQQLLLRVCLPLGLFLRAP